MSASKGGFCGKDSVKRWEGKGNGGIFVLGEGFAAAEPPLVENHGAGEVALPDGLAVVVAGVQGGVFRVGEVGEGHLVETDV